MAAEHGEANTGWRFLNRPEMGLADVISDRVGSSLADTRIVRLLRGEPTLLLFSDYGGQHKRASHEIISLLACTFEGLRQFDALRRQLRNKTLGSQRRISYKTFNDKIRQRALPAYLEAASELQGLALNIAIDKNAIWRCVEEYNSESAAGMLEPWASSSFKKLTRVGHLGAIFVEGVRRDGQNLVWITDEDEIAPNEFKHREATRVIGHFLNSYCTGTMGHFRFGTTMSDTGDRLIEDLAAVPDLSAGCLSDILSFVYPHPQSSTVNRLFIPNGDAIPVKVHKIASWLANSTDRLVKVNIVIDELEDGCSTRSLQIVTDLGQL